jgi:hypothetical protein
MMSSSSTTSTMILARTINSLTIVVFAMAKMTTMLLRSLISKAGLYRFKVLYWCDEGKIAKSVFLWYTQYIYLYREAV